MFDCGEVFEEALSQRLAGLHAFALFVACDQTREAEALLSGAVKRGYEQCLDGLDAGAALDRSFIELALKARDAIRPALAVPLTVTPGATRALSRTDPVAVRRAAVRIPAAARIAIWLVVVERRSYAEAAALLGTDTGEVARLLEWRDALIREALADHGGGDLRAARIH